MTPSRAVDSGGLTLGLRANRRQFALLVAINAFVGSMVGLERSVLPVLAEREFGVASSSLAISFIATFGLAKAVTNVAAGQLAGRFRRRDLLVAGWIAGLPVPIVIIIAPAWSFIVAANVLLGVSQGLTWSMTVNMKVDLVGPRQRGLALGLNEAAGYIAVGGAAFLTGSIADRSGVRPEPFYLGIACAAAGLALTAVFVRDTAGHVALESASHPPASRRKTGGQVRPAWRQARLVGAWQAGFVNNLNDAVIWGLFPIMFAVQGLSLERIGTLAAVYPIFWGSLQMVTGWLSDHYGRRELIVPGMVLQAAGLWASAVAGSFAVWFASLAVVGVGTAMVYPTLLAAVGDYVWPEKRASAMGVYRFWRDFGFVVGAIAGGVLADAFGLSPAVKVIAGLTLVSGVVAAMTLEKRPSRIEESPADESGPVRARRTWEQFVPGRIRRAPGAPDRP